MCVYREVSHAFTPLQKSVNNFQESFLFFNHVSFKDQKQLVRLSSKHFNAVNHLTDTWYLTLNNIKRIIPTECTL